LLAAPGQSVQETSTAVGFENLSSFTRAFTQFCGQTPSMYRKRTVAERISSATRRPAGTVPDGEGY
jgi:AraC-like DNA-binding protein